MSLRVSVVAGFSAGTPVGVRIGDEPMYTLKEDGVYRGDVKVGGRMPDPARLHPATPMAVDQSAPEPQRISAEHAALLARSSTTTQPKALPFDLTTLNWPAVECDDNEVFHCAMCMTNKRDVALFCGHTLLCVKCARAIGTAAKLTGTRAQCPVCKSRVKGAIKVFL